MYAQTHMLEVKFRCMSTRLSCVNMQGHMSFYLAHELPNRFAIVRCFLSLSLSPSLASLFLSLLCVHPPAASVTRFVKFVCQICRCFSNIKSIKTCSGTAPYSILNDVLYLSHHGHAGGPSLAHRHHSRPTGAGFTSSRTSTAWLRGASSPT